MACRQKDNPVSGIIEFHGALFDAELGNIVQCLEYMDCGSLFDVKTKIGPLPEHVLGKIFVQVVNGLCHMHKARRVHRDIKPHNIVVNTKGEAKLTDFGLTTELKSSLADCKTMCGTYSYMSPERITHERYDFKCDIWGIGISLYECAAGQFPYNVQNGVYLDLIDRIVNDPVPQMKNGASFSAEFLDFVSVCMEKDQEKRPSAEDLRDHPWIRNASQIEFDLGKWLKRKLDIQETDTQAIDMSMSGTGMSVSM
eukprot:TRINITY_DN1695_c0_g1_i1.p1 TRINITY_DN1695_c0_g1~~TRINITY_DN1695_c0_g1_i1.p1  ORF type:complete len:254 (+),score=41.87 TRINITY_DN1695_c0_g1_i1:325-1086(+)